MYLSGRPGGVVNGKKRYAKHDRLVCARSRTGVCPNRNQYSVQRLERAFLDHGLQMLHQASDFAAASAEIDSLAARLTAAEAAVAEAKEAVTNAKRMILRARNDDLAALAESAAQDALDALKKAEQERDDAAFRLEAVKGSDPDRTFREAEELAAECLAGNQESRRRMFGLVRSLIAGVRFEHVTYRAYYQSARAPHFELWADLNGDNGRRGFRRRDWEERKLAAE